MLVFIIDFDIFISINEYLFIKLKEQNEKYKKLKNFCISSGDICRFSTCYKFLKSQKKIEFNEMKEIGS